MPGDSAYVREHNTPTEAAVHARRPLLTARGVDLSMMLTGGPLTTPGLAAPLMSPALLRRYGLPSRNRCPHHPAFGGEPGR